LTADPDHTWLVECFAPGIDDAAVAAAADRVRAVLADGEAEDTQPEYLGALLMAEDEVVFHAFRAADVEAVRAVSAAAGLEFERVVESRGVVSGAALGPELTEHLIRTGAPATGHAQ
jgi:predicted NAD/FAD-binding protein